VQLSFKFSSCKYSKNALFLPNNRNYTLYELARVCTCLYLQPARILILQYGSTFPYSSQNNWQMYQILNTAQETTARPATLRIAQHNRLLAPVSEKQFKGRAAALLLERLPYYSFCCWRSHAGCSSWNHKKPDPRVAIWYTQYSDSISFVLNYCILNVQ
jgi:hypothetical protein